MITATRTEMDAVYMKDGEEVRVPVLAYEQTPPAGLVVALVSAGNGETTLTEAGSAPHGNFLRLAPPVDELQSTGINAIESLMDLAKSILLSSNTPPLPSPHEYVHRAVIDSAMVEADAAYIAQVCHEVNRAYCEAIGDNSQKPWLEAEHWQRQSAVDGVKAAKKSGSTPETQHASWLAAKLADGWKYGEVKDAALKTHPCIMPYSDLPTAQKVKDHLFLAVVRVLESYVTVAPPDGLDG